ncbi:DUF1272 domain-containing protein [Niveispirillum sp.]|uniref:DUF1272 domain-containing protein n=1 Tax=Niveispirillum sp. TaxID=1917217 RepID=UPI0025CF20DC|nr:DUF1272 domain-containing protein [Niveispirillum sp.]
MRPGCECCDRDLPADLAGAFICSFECTWCRDCTEQVLKGTCPNCGGTLSPRPPRARIKWDRYPPSTVRIFKPEGCRSGF